MSAATIRSFRWQEREEEEKKARIRKFYVSGNYTYEAIGRMFKISGKRVGQIVREGENGKLFR